MTITPQRSTAPPNDSTETPSPSSMGRILGCTKVVVRVIAGASVVALALQFVLFLQAPSFSFMNGLQFRRAGPNSWHYEGADSGGKVFKAIESHSSDVRWIEAGSIDKVNGEWQNFVADDEWEILWTSKLPNTVEIDVRRRPLFVKFSRLID